MGGGLCCRCSRRACACGTASVAAARLAPASKRVPPTMPRPVCAVGQVLYPEECKDARPECADWAAAGAAAPLPCSRVAECQPILAQTVQPMREHRPCRGVREKQGVYARRCELPGSLPRRLRRLRNLRRRRPRWVPVRCRCAAAWSATAGFIVAGVVRQACCFSVVCRALHPAVPLQGTAAPFCMQRARAATACGLATCLWMSWKCRLEVFRLARRSMAPAPASAVI